MFHCASAEPGSWPVLHGPFRWIGSEHILSALEGSASRIDWMRSEWYPKGGARLWSMPPGLALIVVDLVETRPRPHCAKPFRHFAPSISIPCRYLASSAKRRSIAMLQETNVTLCFRHRGHHALFGNQDPIRYMRQGSGDRIGYVHLKKRQTAAVSGTDAVRWNSMSTRPSIGRRHCSPLPEGVGRCFGAFNYPRCLRREELFPGPCIVEPGPRQRTIRPSDCESPGGTQSDLPARPSRVRVAPMKVACVRHHRESLGRRSRGTIGRDDRRIGQGPAAPFLLGWPRAGDLPPGQSIQALARRLAESRALSPGPSHHRDDG